MHVYVDHVKLKVDKLESVYIINQQFGHGILRYKGRILNSENNFLYYGISDGDHISLKGLKGGKSKFFIIVFTIIVILFFILLLFSGLITVWSNLVIGTIKYGFVSLLDGNNKRKVLPILNIIIDIIFLILICASIYLTVYSLATITGLLVFYSKSSDQGSTLSVLCKNSHSSSKIGFWTGITFSIIYLINRLPSTLYIISKMDNVFSNMISFIFGIPLQISEKMNTFLKAMALAIFPPIMLYAETVPSLIEFLYKTLDGLDLSTDGQQLEGQSFNCENASDLNKLAGMVFNTSIEIKEELNETGIKKYVELFKYKLAHDIYKQRYNPSLNALYKNNKKTIYDYSSAYDEMEQSAAHNPIEGLLGNYAKSNMSEYIVCQLLGAISIINKYKKHISADSTDTSDMVVSGISAGVYSTIVYIISLVYYAFIKSN